MLKIFLWLRYLGKRRVVLLSVAAVTLSSALLIVVASLFNGFIGAFEQAAVDAVGDIVITPSAKIADYPELIRRLEGVGPVEAATATLTAQGLLNLGRGNVRAVEIWGIEVQKRGRVTAFEKSLLKGEGKAGEEQFAADNQPIEGYVGIGVLAEPNEQTDEYDFNAVRQYIGREVVLTTGSTSLTTGGSTSVAEGVQKFRRKTIQFVIEGIEFSGVYYFDRQMVYLPIERLQAAVYPDSKQPIASQIQIKLKTGSDEDSAIAQIRGVWKVFASEGLGWNEYEINQTWIETARQMQSRLVAEFRKQMGILLLIFGAVSMSAVLLVFCIFYMIVETRRRDVAILKSCGATSSTVAVIFLGFGGCVGAAGAAAGTVAGYIITKNINAIEGWIRIAFGLKLWKASVYMFSRIPNEVDWQAVIWIVLSAVAGAAIGAAIPAISAAMTRPVNVLRYE
jgi:lipoprotein-releasing system permease protein